MPVRYINNIIQHQGEAKYRRIRVSNKAFQSRVCEVRTVLRTVTRADT